ncbi:hypothetical protein STAS_23514 [Striga asiatica]|uniref:Uncharacterized protein n=1 Tax=Striga asiatica TaxID=4170 RepID=A0A5A7QMN3_STRAF|nr:hypothetical protein STAS_23514 [Striga asiatica]
MGGGFMFTGKPISSATRPPFIGAARNLHTAVSPAAADGGTQQISQNNGDCRFGSAPTRAEVDRAIIDLHRLMQGLQTSGPDPNGLHSLSPTNGNEAHMLQAPGFAKFHDVYSMMQKEPSFQSMVVSISCDKGVWEAILGNKAVQDLKGSIPIADNEEKRPSCIVEEQDIAMLVLKWIMGFTKSRILELVEKFGLLVTDIFKPAPKEKPTSELTDLLEEKVRSSLLLSVVILLIVVVTRNQG